MKDIYTRNESFTFKGFHFNFNHTNFNTSITNKLIQYHDLYLQDHDVEVLVLNSSITNRDFFQLKIKYNKQVVMHVSSLRTLDYALKALKESIYIKDGQRHLKIQTIVDEPDFILRGIIEGFYGNPYNFDIRKDIIEFSKQYRFNSYFYAPKDDLYHRDKWRLLYPENELKDLKVLNEYALDHFIDFYYCISPGLDFEYDNPDDYEALFRKIDQLQSINIKYFALLMDDLPIQNDKNTDMYLLATQHAKLANKLSNYLNKQAICFCPTDYYQNTNTKYREAIKQHLDAHIPVFWTGYNTVAEKIDVQETKDVQEAFGHDLILWDNYPVNDFNPKSRLYLGPIKNRSKALSKYHVGYVANPSSRWYASKIPLVSIAKYIDDVTTYNLETVKQDMVDIFAEDLSIRTALLQLIKYHETSVLGISDYDIQMHRLYETSNFKVLDKVYAVVENTYQTLRKMTNQSLLNDLNLYLDYMEMEVKLYQQLKLQQIDETLFDKMFHAKEKTSNVAILKHIIKSKFVKGDYEFEDERTNFWSYQDQNS